MANKEKIMARLAEHLEKAKEKVPYDRIVGIFLQGSQNYKLDYENSDIDTKVIVLPSLEDIILNRKPVSTTLVMDNDEHVDLKDIRFMFDSFKKQNINFVEILFTDYFILNPKYETVFFQKVMYFKHEIAAYCPFAAVSCMKGMAFEKLAALKHPYPTVLPKIEKFGYDPKQLHHILRMEEFLDRYVAGEKYADCLISKKADWLKDIKRGILSEVDATELANKTTEKVAKVADAYREKVGKTTLCKVDTVLEEALVDIFKLNLNITN